MARLPRLTLAGLPHHVIQRGNDRQAIVRDDADRQALLDLIGEQARANGVALHAWVLMDNHFHLLVTPATIEGVPRMMQAVGRSYVRRFNHRHGRSGTLWEGRYRSTLVQPGPQLLACMAYIDLNPVRAGLVSDPLDYRWSSHRHHAGHESGRFLSPHAAYWALGNTPFAREGAYRELVHAGLSADQQARIADATLHGWALGDVDFVASLQALTPRPLTRAARGRPPAAT